MPAPAPWATTIVANARAGRAYTPLTSPLSGTANVRRSSGVGITCHDARRDGKLLPRDLRIRLRRLETRRVLSGGTEEPGDALLLLLAAELGRDQLHVPPIPHQELPHHLARAGGRRIRIHPESEPADHALEAVEGCRRRRPRLPGPGEAARGPAGMRVVPVPAEPAVRPDADRTVRGVPAAGSAAGSRWSSGIPRGSRRATCCATRASPGASPRPTTRTPRRAICPGSRPATCGCARRSTRTRSCRSGPEGSGRPWTRAADVFTYFKHEDEGASPKMAKRLEDLLGNATS